MRFRTGSIAILLVIAAVNGAFSQEPSKTPDPEKRILYEWVDREGIVHLTDRLDKVPQEFRSKAKISEQAPAEEQEGSGRQPSISPLSGTPSAGNEESLRNAWQQRMASARNRRAAAEVKYRQLIQERDRLQEQWGHGLYGYTPEVSRQLEKLDIQIEQTKRDADEAARNVEVTIPEEARKAGIPPGWLRE